MDKQEIFNFLSGLREQYAYVVAFVKASTDEKSGIRSITEINWMDTIPSGDEDEIEVSIRDIDRIDVEDGYYIMKILFSVERDSDDYRSWHYYVPEIVEFEFQHSIEKQEEWDKEMEELDKIESPLDDLFKDFKND